MRAVSFFNGLETMAVVHLIMTNALIRQSIVRYFSRAEVICVPQTEQESTFILDNAIKVLPVPRLIANFADVKQIPMKKVRKFKVNFENSALFHLKSTSKCVILR